MEVYTLKQNLSLQMADCVQNKNDAQVGLWTRNISTLKGKGLEIPDDLLKTRIDMYYLQEVMWRGYGARLIGLQGIRYKLL